MDTGEGHDVAHRKNQREDRFITNYVAAEKCLMEIWEAKTNMYFATSMSGIRESLVWTYLFDAFELTIGFIYSHEFIDIVLPQQTIPKSRDRSSR